MPAQYVAMRDKFARKMGMKAAKRKAAMIYNADPKHKKHPVGRYTDSLEAIVNNLTEKREFRDTVDWDKVKAIGKTPADIAKKADEILTGKQDRFEKLSTLPMIFPDAETGERRVGSTWTPLSFHKYQAQNSGIPFIGAIRDDAERRIEHPLAKVISFKKKEHLETIISNLIEKETTPLRHEMAVVINKARKVHNNPGALKDLKVARDIAWTDQFGDPEEHAHRAVHYQKALTRMGESVLTERIKNNETRHEFFKRNLKKMGLYKKTSNYKGAIGKAVEQLSDFFSKQKHSGMSAAATHNTYHKLMKAWRKEAYSLHEAEWCGTKPKASWCGTTTEDKIPGGEDKKDLPKFLSRFDPDEVAMGISTEKEHTEDPKLAAEIASDHLGEDPHYYTKLSNMEKKSPKHVAIDLKYGYRDMPWNMGENKVDKIISDLVEKRLGWGPENHLARTIQHATNVASGKPLNPTYDKPHERVYKKETPEEKKEYYKAISQAYEYLAKKNPKKYGKIDFDAPSNLDDLI